MPGEIPTSYDMKSKALDADFNSDMKSKAQLPDKNNGNPGRKRNLVQNPKLILLAALAGGTRLAGAAASLLVRNPQFPYRLVQSRPRVPGSAA